MEINIEIDTRALSDESYAAEAKVQLDQAQRVVDSFIKHYKDNPPPEEPDEFDGEEDSGDEENYDEGTESDDLDEGSGRHRMGEKIKMKVPKDPETSEEYWPEVNEDEMEEPPEPPGFNAPNDLPPIDFNRKRQKAVGQTTKRMPILKPKTRGKRKLGFMKRR